MWNPPNDQSGQVAARMETTPSLGSASISVSQQQAPKKFAPMVAPKPKFNPYKQMGDAGLSDPAGNKTKKCLKVLISSTLLKGGRIMEM